MILSGSGGVLLVSDNCMQQQEEINKMIRGGILALGAVKLLAYGVDIT